MIMAKLYVSQCIRFSSPHLGLSCSHLPMVFIPLITVLSLDQVPPQLTSHNTLLHPLMCTYLYVSTKTSNKVINVSVVTLSLNTTQLYFTRVEDLTLRPHCCQLSVKLGL